MSDRPTSLWQRITADWPRQLSFTREGRVVVTLAFATGFSAINTGNNLLYLGWGLVISAIVISGLLSEAGLRVLTLGPRGAVRARAGEIARIPLAMTNGSARLPAFGIELELAVEPPHPERIATPVSARGSYVLKLSPNATLDVTAALGAQQRGAHRLTAAHFKTAYPFGFFVKTRRVPLEPAPTVWVRPPAVDVDALMPQVLSRLGETSSARVGHGDEFHALRTFRLGDDVRRIRWRPSARRNRWLVAEHATSLGRTVWLELGGASAAAPGEPRAELAIATLGSLAEALLARDFAVGVCAPGLELVPDRGRGHAERILDGLARLDLAQSAGQPLPPRGVTRIRVTAGSGAGPSPADVEVVP